MKVPVFGLISQYCGTNKETWKKNAMANLFFGKVQTGGEYVDVEVLSGVTLTAGTSYLMQVQGVATICVSSTQPTDAGFCLYNSQIFQYTPNGSDKLWIRSHGAAAFLNIAT